MRLYTMDLSNDRDLLRALDTQTDARTAALPLSRRKERLAFRLLLARAAAEEGIPTPRLGKNKYGKPHAVGAPGFYFNLSHSGDRAVLLCDDAPVGVDIERVRDIDLGVARKFALPSEQEWIESGEDEAENLRRFFLLWTLKEAYIKAEGRGLGLSMKSVVFTLTQNADGSYRVASNRRRWVFTVCLTADGYALATAVRRVKGGVSRG